MNGLLDYQCSVYESGYEIVTGHQFMKDFRKKSRGEIFKERPSSEDITWFIRPIDRLSPIRRYNMMNHSGVFHEFADLVSNIAEIVDSGKSKITLDSEESMMVDEDLENSKKQNYRVCK